MCFFKASFGAIFHHVNGYFVICFWVVLSDWFPCERRIREVGFNEIFYTPLLINESNFTVQEKEGNFGQKVPAVSKHLQIFGYKNLLESFLTLENSSTTYATSGVI